METTVLIVGAGPAGLAMSVCLSNILVSNIMLEKEDCHASLWKRRSYNRLHLHLAKEFCELPYMPHLPETPTFMPKETFIDYMDKYVREYNLSPLFSRYVVSASFDQVLRKWIVEAENSISGEIERYVAKFLVVATGENSSPYIPRVPGLDSFSGSLIHSSQYKNGSEYEGKNVLVVGSGNSGMEISLDLSNYGARPSIVIRSPFHVVTREMIYRGMRLLKYLPLSVVDALVGLETRIEYGDLSPFGIDRPSDGPFTHKLLTGKTPVIDVGTVKKIRSGEIQVVPEMIEVTQDMVEFKNGTKQHFDAIVFATGYKSVAKDWLKDYSFIFNDDGMPKNSFPSHWKGENGIYCIGFSRNGILGITNDAKNVANDISMNLGA